MGALFFIAAMLLISGIGIQKREISSEPLNLEISIASKGAAAILVLLSHFNIAFQEEHPFLCVGYLGVALFFFWSGYGAVLGREQPGIFWKKRLTKLFIPYLTASVLYHIVRESFGDGGSFIGIFTGVLNVGLVDNSWYIFALVFMLFPAKLILQNDKLSKRKQSIFLILSVIAISLLEFTGVKSGRAYYCYSNLAFLLGIGICIYDREMKYWKWYLLISPVAWFISMAIHPGFQRLFGYYSDVVMILSNNGTSAFLVLLVMTLLAIFGKPNKVSLLLGKYSYEIYLLHGLWIRIFKRASITQSFWLNCAMVIVCTVAMSVPMHLLNQKIIGFFLQSTHGGKNE